MADYKVSTVAGTSWQRAGQIVLTNPISGTPTVYYNEETAINLGTEIITHPCGNLPVPCVDMAEVIPLLDPATGIATGQTMLIEQVYQAIYSHYIASAIARDVAAAVTAKETIA